MKRKLGKVFVPALVLSMLCQSMAGMAVNAETRSSKINISPEKITAKCASGHEAFAAVDGNASTYWQSIPSNGEGSNYKRMYDHNRYIDITLDGTYKLSEIKIFNKVDNSYNNYYVYASVDGVNYDKIISKTSNDAATAEGDSHVVNAEASYLRLNMAYNSDSFATNLAEIEVYGTKVSDTVAEPAEIQVENWEGSKWQQEWDRFEKDADYASEKTLAEMSNLVGRVLGEEWKSSFRFEMRKSLIDKKDVFELKDGEDGTIVIRGNNGIAMASGFNYYLKNYVNVDYNPLYESNVSLDEIKPVGKKVVKEAQFDLRYALNFCTYSYTMSFWNWDEYEEFLDWCAMNGINLVLDIVGQEEVLRQTLHEFHYTDEEIKDYISGPAYFAWFYMQNLYSIGGPLPDAWFEQRVELGRKMHDRMQTYGISPVIQGFAGQVPETFAQKNEGAVLTPIDGWSGFTRPSIIKTYLTESEIAAGKRNYFQDAAEVFYEKQKNVFGDVSDYYATDPFHEGGATGGLDIANIFKTVQDEMLKSNPDAKWVMQHWQDGQKAMKMSRMDTSKVIALDLQTDMNPQYTVFENNGTPWIYCMLHNFGGRMGLDGAVPLIASGPAATFNSTKNMAGIGITPEAMENSPVVYELLFDTNWSKDPVDYEEWIKKYCERRAGGTSESLQEAWDILLNTAYADKGVYYQGAAETVINARPADGFGSASTWGHSNIYYDKKELDRALLLLADNYEAFASSPAYKYDLADVAEQVLCNAAVEYHSLMVAAKNQGDLEKFTNLSTQFLDLIELSDQILSTTDEFMLGTWIEAARKMITNADDWTKDLFEFNARSLVTTWGGERVGSLKDYSNRKWAGLTSDFYKERWAIWIRNRIAELKGETKDAADKKAEDNWFMWEYQWANRKSDDENGRYAFDTTPSNADLSELAQRAYVNFSCTNLEENTGGAAAKKVNVAKDKTVTTASATQSGAVANITDGTTSTEWIASGEGPHTIEIDLAGTYQVSGARLSIPQFAKQFPYTWKLEYYEPDSSSWKVWKEYKDEKMGSNVDVVTANPYTASKIRVTMTTSDVVNSPLTITEIEIYSTAADETEYYNLAEKILPTTNKTNTASSNPLSNITDGKTNTFWKTDDWGSSAYPAWVEVDLGSVHSAEYAEVWFESAGRPFQFYVTVTGEDGSEQEVLTEYKEHTGVLDSASYRIDIPDKKLRKIKVYLTGITGQGDYGLSGPAVAEIKVMSSEQQEGPQQPEAGFPDCKISGAAVSGGNVTEAVVDGSRTSYCLVNKNEDIVFDLKGACYVDHADFTFEKAGLGIKYQVYAVDTAGTRKLIYDKSDTLELLGQPVVSVPVGEEITQLVFIHMGNNGQGDAYAAESRLYEVEIYGGRKKAVKSITPADAEILISGNANVSYAVNAGEQLVLTLEKAQSIGIAGVEKAEGEEGALQFTVEYLDGEIWKPFADLSENMAEDAKIFAAAKAPVSTASIRLTFEKAARLAGVKLLQTESSRIDRSELLSVIADALDLMEKLDKWGLTAEKAELQQLYEAARKAYDTYRITQTDIDLAQASLSDRVSEIQKVVEKNEQAEEIKETRDNLRKEIDNAAAALKQSDYTEETWKAYAEALEKAEQMLNNPNVSLEELQNAGQQLEKAMAGLVKVNVKPTPTPTPTPNPGVVLPKTGEVHQIKKLVYRITASTDTQKTVTVVKPVKKNNRKITIPAAVKIKGYVYRVTEIGPKAFRKNAKLTQAVIGKNVVKIGGQAFADCKKLNKVTIKSKVLKTVGKKAFKGMKAKARIIVPKAKYKAYKKYLQKSKLAKNVKIVKK